MPCLHRNENQKLHLKISHLEKERDQQRVNKTTSAENESGDGWTFLEETSEKQTASTGEKVFNLYI